MLSVYVLWNITCLISSSILVGLTSLEFLIYIYFQKETRPTSPTLNSPCVSTKQSGTSQLLFSETLESTAYTYTMEYYSAKKQKEIMPFAATWMDLEIIRLHEVNRKRKINTM